MSEKQPMAEAHEDNDGFLRRSDMTLRDYFAGQVAPYFAKIAMDTKSDIKHAAGASYEFADAMLEARK